MGDIDFGELIRKHYKFFILAICIVFIVVMYMIYQSFWLLLPEQSKLNVERAKNAKFDTWIELFEYYESEYISLVLADEKGYREMVNARLRLPPVEGNILNENFYLSVINDAAEFNNYISFIINDEAQGLKVKVLCEDGKVSKITINGIEDYFTYKRNEFAQREYKEIKEVEFADISGIIGDLVNNGWNSNHSFGTRDSIFNGYDIYFEEGIAVRKVQGKVYNVVFNEKYRAPIINGVLVEDTSGAIRKRLGKPSYEDTKNNIIGYKTKDFYIFFGENLVSVYRNEDFDVKPMLALLDKYRKDEIDLLEFMSELTYTWPDYNEYYYTPSSVYLSYALKGFEIKINYENERGFIFYNNFNLSEDKIEHYLDSEDFKAYLQSDSVFNIERAREKEDKELLEKNEIQDENFLKNNTYNVFFDKAENGVILKAYFVSKDGTKVNRELNDSINSYGWVAENYFVFSKAQKGIYGFNLDTGNVETLITGERNFNITETRESVFVYDGIEQIIGF